MRRQPSFSRESFGVKNKAPWTTMLGHTFHQFHDNDLFTSAAAMSYFGLLTLFPGLILLLALGKRLTAGTDMLNEMLRRVAQAYPGSGEFLDSTVRSLSDLGTGVIITCVVVTLWAGSWVFAVQQLAGRLSPRQLERWSWIGSLGSAFWQIVFVLVSIFITVILFMLVYRFMPNARVHLRDTIPGAIIGGLLWEAAKYIFAWRWHYFHYDQIYGSVGAVVAVLTWGYFSSLILLYGAQLTAVFHREHPAEPIKPSAADAAIAPMP